MQLALCRRISLTSSIFQRCFLFNLSSVYGNIFALFRFVFIFVSRCCHLLNGMTCVLLLFRYHGFDELIFNCWQLVYQRTAQMIGFSLNMHDIWDTGHYGSNRFVRTIEVYTSANYLSIRLNPYSLSWKWSVSTMFFANMKISNSRQPRHRQ